MFAASDDTHGQAGMGSLPASIPPMAPAPTTQTLQCIPSTRLRPHASGGSGDRFMVGDYNMSGALRDEPA